MGNAHALKTWTASDGQDLLDGRIWTPEGRLSFPNLFAAKSMGESEAKYDGALLFPKEVSLALVRLCARKAIIKTWGEDKAKWPGVLRTGDLKTLLVGSEDKTWPVKDGDTKAYAGYADHSFIRAASTNKPSVWGPREPQIDEQDVYAGCYGRMLITAYGWNNKFGKGVSFSLLAFQKTRDGEPFTNRVGMGDFIPYQELTDAVNPDDMSW